jgi:1-acyl-sn-glycerol-3-phosphate acyltransferase
MIPNPLRLLWATWAWLLLLPTLVIAAVPILALPRLGHRRTLARAACLGYFRLCGLPVRVLGLERLPAGACIIVANHASYVDGPLLFACLPPRFGFVIKKEASRIPFAGGLLRRLGHHFVERRNRQEGGSDARTQPLPQRCVRRGGAHRRAGRAGRDPRHAAHPGRRLHPAALGPHRG